jgi:hypothetical protein
MNFRTLTAAAAITLALTGISYAACRVDRASYKFASPNQNQGTNSVASKNQFAPQNENQGSNSVASRHQFAPPNQNQGSNSVAWRQRIRTAA